MSLWHKRAGVATYMLRKSPHLCQLRVLPNSDVVQNGLEGLSFEHHILDEVHIQVVQVEGADGLRELGLELIHLVLQGPHLSHGCLHELRVGGQISAVEKTESCCERDRELDGH